MSIVTMIPPGSSLGMIAFAIAPAISPSTIQPMIPMMPSTLTGAIERSLAG
jgi:hypothetical protein